MSRSYEESRIQRAIVAHYRKTYAGKIVHVPNGGKRGRLEAIRFKEEGVESGHPDLIIYNDGRVYLMEVKAPGGVYSDNQKAFIQHLRDDGFDVAGVESLDEAKRAFEAWGLSLKAPRVRSEAELTTGF